MDIEMNGFLVKGYKMDKKNKKNMLARELLRKMDRVLLQADMADGVSGAAIPKKPIVLFFRWRSLTVYYYGKTCYFLGTDNGNYPAWCFSGYLRNTGASNVLDATSFVAQFPMLNDIHLSVYNDQYYIGTRFHLAPGHKVPSFMPRRSNPRGHPFYDARTDKFNFVDIAVSGNVAELIGDVNAQESV